MAAVDKIEQKRKREDFIGHRNREMDNFPLSFFACAALRRFARR